MATLRLVKFFGTDSYALQGEGDLSENADFSLYELDGSGGDPFAFGNCEWGIVEEVEGSDYDPTDADDFWWALDRIHEQITEEHRDNWDILEEYQLEEGAFNDHPNTAFLIRHKYTGKQGWVAGPSGTYCCAIAAWLAGSGPELAETKEQAIEEGCFFGKPEDL